MNNKIINIVKNFSYSFVANIISLLISLIVIAFVPKVLGIEEYGYFQLYLFYTTFIGFFHFGWPDGIYLRYGGKDYKNLKKELFIIQFWLMVIFEFLITIVITTIIGFALGRCDKSFILFMTCICGIIILPRTFLLLTLQATNRIKDYVKITMFEKVIYLFLILIIIYNGVDYYSVLIVADLIGKLLSLIYAVFICKDIVFGKIVTISKGLQEAYKNIHTGSKLMLANLTSMLIIGIVRAGIEYRWDIETFGKLSLTMSITNLFMIFINSISIVIFPMICGTSQEELPKVYGILRNVLMIPLLGMLVMYYPVKTILSLWLPSYKESLAFMSLLLPICVYESKMSMLVNTYLKSLRKEKWILTVNLITVFLSLFLSLTTIFVLNNLYISIVIIVILLAFRCIIAEILLSKIIDINIKKDIVLELILCNLFMITGWIINTYWSSFIYGVGYIIYLFMKKKDIIVMIHVIKASVLKEKINKYHRFSRGGNI